MQHRLRHCKCRHCGRVVAGCHASHPAQPVVTELSNGTASPRELLCRVSLHKGAEPMDSRGESLFEFPEFAWSAGSHSSLPATVCVHIDRPCLAAARHCTAIDLRIDDLKESKRSAHSDPQVRRAAWRRQVSKVILHPSARLLGCPLCKSMRLSACESFV